MNSTKKQLAEMLTELQSRSKAQVILESGFFDFDFVVFVSRELHNSPSHAAKPSATNNY